MLSSQSVLKKKLSKLVGNGFRLPTLLSIIALTFLIPFNTIAQGNLLVTPRRVVFDGSKRTITLNLANIGNDTATYFISLVQIRMTEAGAFETITEPDPGQKFANKNLRYFPRSVTLPSNEAQVVKVQLIKASQLSPGEYRSHFYFRSVPKVNPLGEEQAVADTTAISVQLTPVFGITIPAIIRKGESNTKVSLSNLSLKVAEDNKPTFSMQFNRTGNFSVYGDLTVDHVSPQGVTTRVGLANGIAVYTPNSVRHFKFKLSNPPNVDFKSGKLLVGYSASTDVKPDKLAEAELLLR